MKKVILTKEAPAPIGPYSQAMEAAGLLFCSGQVSIDPSSGNVITTDVKAQTEQVMKNLEAVLKAGGVSFKNVVKTTIFLTDMKDFATVNEIYGRFFPSEAPARSTIAVAGLPKGVNVEIEMIAAK
jgi:2-iminobutanoate/2-iminopropanoate deaminase